MTFSQSTMFSTTLFSLFKQMIPLQFDLRNWSQNLVMSIQVLKVLLHSTAHENLILRTKYCAVTNANGYFLYLFLMPKKLRIKKINERMFFFFSFFTLNTINSLHKLICIDMSQPRHEEMENWNRMSSIVDKCFWQVDKWSSSNASYRPYLQYQLLSDM